MINIKLDNERYRYDVYIIVNQFYGFTNVNFANDNFDYKVSINDIQIVISDNKEENVEVTDFILGNKSNEKQQVKKAVFRYFKGITDKTLPWGTLVGIRPTKIALNLLKEGKDENSIIEHFKEYYLAREDKAKLCIEVAKKELELVNDTKNHVSVYIGMPFCPTRCLYCSFTSNNVNKSCSMVENYIEALKKEITSLKEFIKAKNLSIDCVYFGGGTPTSVSEIQFENILEHIYESFVKDYDVREFNVECGRPDSITSEKLKTMKKFNVDRISINPQTMNDDTLKRIGRGHTTKDIVDKFRMARELNFTNINMDIIVGLPGENLEHIIKTCDEIVKLSPDSITVHGMSIKRGSKLFDQVISNDKFSIPSQNTLNSMYEKTEELACQLHMYPYYMYRQKNMVGNMENVGYCNHKKEGLYNIQMIEEKQTIIALGADAVTKVVFLDENRLERSANVKDVKEYIIRIDEMISRKINLLNTLY